MIGLRLDVVLIHCLGARSLTPARQIGEFLPVTGRCTMNLKNILRGFVVHFVLVLIVSAVVSYLYSLVAHGQGIIDWESSFRLATIFGITLPIMSELEHKER